LEKETTPWTLTQWVKRHSAKILDPVATAFLHLGFHPNFITVSGFVFGIISGIFAGMGYFGKCAFFLMVSGLFDALDGTLARRGGFESRFGAFLDSFMDRYAESAVFFGLAYYATLQGRHDMVLLVFASMVGSIMVSYARARAEGVGISCKVGLFTRMERFLVLILSLFSEKIFIGLLILAIMTNLTALQRMIHVFKQSRKG
jgi:CDP-diacylglycerol--glycerol-3-phosphate 3-phosphatidyltransferase